MLVVPVVVAFALGSVLAAQQPVRPDDYYRIRTAADAQISPDGSTVAYVERTIDRAADRGRSRIWLLTVADGSARRLSGPDDDDSSPRWSPDGRALAFASSVAGKRAIVVSRLADQARQVVATYQTTNEPLAGGVNLGFAWSPDGYSIAYLSADPGAEPPPGDPIVVTRYSYKAWNAMADNRWWHVYLAVVATGASRQLTSGPHQDHSIAWSPSGEEIAFVSNRETDPDRIHNYDLFAVRVTDGRVRQLTRTKGSEYLPVWSPDGRTIAYLGGTRPLVTRESSPEDPHIWVVDASGGVGWEIAPTLDRRITAVRWGGTGGELLFTAHDHGNVALYRTTADGGGVTPVVNEPGRVSGFSRSGTGELAYIFQSAREPAEVVVRPATGPSRQLTHLNRDWLGERVVSLPEPFEFSSFDGTRVEGFLFAPVQRIPGRRYPLIVVLHGGPHDHQGLVFSHRAQVYAGLGYVVAMINYRGSTGYGQKFADGTVGDQNGGEAKDVLAGVDHLLRHFSFIDPDRLGIEGGSYGGQLVNWLITQTPRFKAAISISGISNFLSFAYTIWAHDYVQVEFGGYPWERDIAAFMWQRSALAHVAKARTPTLFIHGEEDQDVSITEAEQMYMGLKEVGVEAMLLRYPREGHGLNEPGHVADALDRSLKWYARFLKPNPTGADDQ